MKFLILLEILIQPPTQLNGLLTKIRLKSKTRSQAFPQDKIILLATRLKKATKSQVSTLR